MFLNDKTFEKFGYLESDLSKGSKKPVLLSCDYCGIEYKTTYKNRVNSNKIVEKDCCSKCKYIKRKDVSLKRDGVSNSAQRPDVRKKISDSGWINSDEFKEKRSKSMISKYGTDNCMIIPEVVEKHKNTMLMKYSVDNILKLKHVSKKAVEKSLESRIKNGKIKTYNGKTIPELAKELEFSRSHFGKLVNAIGFESAVLHEKNVSSLEKAIMLWLDGEKISYTKQQKISKFIADIKINDLIIECDGLYWHSDKFLSKTYHIEKKNKYAELGFRSLFFRSDEIINKTDIVKSIILNKLNICKKKYYARKLSVEQISYKESSDFIEKNHLMGGSNISSFNVGLFNGSELVSCMQFKNRGDRNYELARYCNTIFTSIPGAYSKMLSFFNKKCDPKSLVNFIDCRYGDGNYLKDLGFKYINTHTGFMWTDGVNTYNRRKFLGSSGYDKGLYKIWDCGQSKYFIEYI